MGRNHARTGALVALASLAVAAGASAQAPAAAPQAQTDVLSDVTIRAYPSGDPTNVMANRLSRFVSSNCFSADVFTPDPTERFNRAYYAEMTGDAEHYAAIRPTAPKKKPRHRYPPALHPGERIFASLSGPMAVPGTGRAPIAPGGNGRSVTNPCLAAATRTRADKNTTFARALAHYDLGEYDEALPLFKQARGELGGIGLGAEASLMIGKMYYAGLGTPKDTTQAIAWFEKTMVDRKPVPVFGTGVRAARYDPVNPGRFYKVVTEAAVLIAGIYGAGDGVPKNPLQTRMWYETAAAESHVPAVKVLGDFYRQGYGGDVNLAKALTYYNAAGGVRHARAKYEAGGMYERGESVAASPDKALKLYREAAVLGDGPAAYALGVAYDLGQGVKADPKAALGFYKDAALAGVPHAQTTIGTYFYEGGQLDKNLPIARAWFEDAAIAGDVDAMVDLAAMQIKGEGGDADLVDAWAWLSLAQKGGRGDVAPGLASLEKRMKPEELAKARALLGDGAP